VIDGTDQPGTAGTTLSVAAERSNWKVIRKQDGRVLVEATWMLSKDGSSLTDDFTSFAQGGSQTNIKYVYKRTVGGGSGFAGDWIGTSQAVSSAFTVQIHPYKNGGLSFTNPDGKTGMKFDGKSARRLSPSAVEIVQKAAGKITQTRQLEVSPDLKTLTITTHISGRTAPNILVFERQ
jgi:hypothetical protein